MKTERIKSSNKNNIHTTQRQRETVRQATLTNHPSSRKSSESEAVKARRVSCGTDAAARAATTANHRLEIGRTGKSNSTRNPYKAIVSSDNLDIDSYLDSPKQTRVTPTIRGKAVGPVGSGRTARHTSNSARNVSRTKPASQEIPSSAPEITSIDKLEFSVQVDATELVGAIDRALGLTREKVLSYRSSKSSFYRHQFVLRFDNGACAIFQMEPTQPNIHTLMQLHINPNHLTTANAKKLLGVWKQMFLHNAKHLAHTLLFRRVDVCADFQHSVDDLILNMDGARSGSTVFVKTGTGGKVQTIYAGSIESARRGTAYDQDASDEYKSFVGELPSAARTAMKDDCEIGLTTTKGRVRIESRNNFKSPLRFDQLPDLDDPFAGYKIYLKRPDRARKPSADYLAYLDCVSLRGMTGARVHLTKHCANVNETRAAVARHERQLVRNTAPWWRPADYNASVIAMLKAAPIWHFLQVLEKS